MISVCISVFGFVQLTAAVKLFIIHLFFVEGWLKSNFKKKQPTSTTIHLIYLFDESFRPKIETTSNSSINMYIASILIL